MKESNFHRQNLESEQDYIQRICSMKDKIGTWQHVADIVNQELGTSYSESRYRKAWKLFNPSDTILQVTHIDDDVASANTAMQNNVINMTLDLIKERQKLNATKTEYMRTIRQQSRFELFYENIKDAIQALPAPQFSPLKSNDTQMEYIVPISDIHYGSNFTSANNHYSIKECERRFNILLSDLIDFIEDRQINKVSVVSLGDDIQGILRLSDLAINETSIVEAVVGVSKLIAAFLNELSKHCAVNYYHVLTSNHSQIRPLGTKASELASEDMELIIANYIKDLLINNDRVNVEFETDKGYLFIPVFNFNVIAMHGHNIKNNATVLRDMTSFHRKLIDYVIMGHYHSKSTTSGNETSAYDTETVVCPSIVGSCPYSDTLGKGSKSAVLVLGFEATQGLIDTHKIILN